MVAPVPQPLPVFEVSDPPTDFLDQTTATECTDIPTTVPAAIRDKIYPPEQLSLAKFIDFSLPRCTSTLSDLPVESDDLDRYFAPLPPDTLLKPRSNKGASKPTISHKTDGSYLVAEDADGIEELGEEDTGSWLDEIDCVQVDQERESCFDMECDIDLRAAAVTQVLEEARGLDSGKEMDEKANCDAEKVDDPDGT